MEKVEDKPKEKLKKPCKKCRDYFKPTGNACKVCDKCLMKNNKERWKKQYFAKKKELDLINHEATLQKWKILSSAFVCGKKIWGKQMTVQRLADDFEIPYTTANRCLALDKANKRNLALMKKGKISSFRLAMICLLKNNEHQDEIVDIVMEDNLSTYNIKHLNFSNMGDINKARHRLAVEQGYSRKSSAYDNFSNWIDRGKIFMLMDRENLPEDKIADVETKLKELNNMINKYIG